MTRTLENMVARYRKVREMVGELEECLKPLKEEAAKLQDEIFAEFSRKPTMYNVCRKKTVSMGFVGKNLVRVDYGKTLERIDGGRRDDQEWLKDFEKKFPGCGFVKTKYELNVAMLQGYLKGEVLTLNGLTKMGLAQKPSYKVKVYRICKDAELNALKTEALALADEIGDEEA